MVDLKVVEDRVDGVAERSLAHAIGVYTYLKRGIWYRDHIMVVLSEGFGEDMARNVWNYILTELGDLDRRRYDRVKVEGVEKRLYEILSNHVYRRHIAHRIEEEARKKLATASGDELKLLTIASAIITRLLKGQDTGLSLSVERGSMREVYVYSPRELSIAVSTALESRDEVNVERLFCKYLLGTLHERTSRGIEIYPDTLKLIEELAARLTNYIGIPSRDEIESTLKNIFENDIFRISAIYNSLERIIHGIHDYLMSDEMNEHFLRTFFGLPIHLLCRESYTKGILYNCIVNPLVYEDVRSVIRSLYEAGVSEIKMRIVRALKNIGYSGPVCDRINECFMTKSGAKPILLHIEPLVTLPRVPSYVYARDPWYGIVMVTRGLPTASILKFIESVQRDKSLALADALWVFVGNNEAYVANTSGYSDIVNALKREWSKVEHLT
mgnify:CR=1 FL=1